MNRRQKIIVSITGITLVLLILVGLTYGYFLTRIQGNSNEKSISAQLADLEVTYQDDTNEVITGEKIMPGTTFTKSFSVRNTGEGEASYSIIFDNVENEFNRVYDWKFTLSKKNGDVVKTGTIPLTKSYILFKTTVAEDGTDEYELKVEYINANEDQSVDMNKTLSLRINIAPAIETTMDKAQTGTLLAKIGSDNLISELLTPLNGTSELSTGLYREETRDLGSEGAGMFGYGECDVYYEGDPEWAENNCDEKEAEVNNWLTGTGYTFDATTGEYTLTGVSRGVKPHNYLIPGGKEKGDRVYLLADDATGFTYISVEWYSVSKVSYLLEPILSSTEDDYGISYYYRGNVKNNFVNFSDKCWRIVRVLGNGNIKLVLADDGNMCNSSNYELENDNSIISGSLDSWKKSIQDRNELVDSEWCKDESINQDADPYGSPFIFYNGQSRLNNPSLKCDFKGLNNSTSKKSTSKIGELTMDEVIFAGASYKYDAGPSNRSAKYYLSDNAYSIGFLTMTPYATNSMESSTYLYLVYCGYLNTTEMSYSYEVGTRPAITISKDTTVTSGTGTQADPYVIG